MGEAATRRVQCAAVRDECRSEVPCSRVLVECHAVAGAGDKRLGERPDGGEIRGGVVEFQVDNLEVRAEIAVPAAVSRESGRGGDCIVTELGDDVVEVELGGFRSLYRVKGVGEGVCVDGDDFRGAGVLCESALDHAVEQGVGAENFRILGG